MISRFNFTDRKRLTKETIGLVLHHTDDDGTYFEVDLQLDGYDFPKDSRIRIEARNSITNQVWDFGTVGNTLKLSQSDRTFESVMESAYFVVSVISPGELGLVLGRSSRITPRDPKGSVKSLLPISPRNDFGQEIWKLNFTDEEPVIFEINNSIEDLSELGLRDSKFRALVMPEVFRSILHYAIITDELDLTDFEDTRWRGWINLAKHYYRAEPVPKITSISDEAKKEEASRWIDAVVNAFANSPKVRAADSYSKKR